MACWPSNCTPEQIGVLHQQTLVAPQSNRILIDLVQNQVHAPRGECFDFSIAASDRELLLEGLDHIEYTLQYAADIDEFEASNRQSRPWSALDSVAG